jgi:hypothetical protein
MLLANFVWETLHLPLYTIWTSGRLSEYAIAVLHCTAGDLLIAICTLTLAIVLVGDHRWPRVHFGRVTAVTILMAVVYTVFSEWLNVSVRAAWGYSEHMPVVDVLGVKVGLSPVLQWLAGPALAFWVSKNVTLQAA